MSSCMHLDSVRCGNEGTDMTAVFNERWKAKLEKINVVISS